MQTLKIDKHEPVALHDQVAAEIRRAIAEGEAAQGEEGLLDFTRGRGVRVVGTPQRGAVLTRIDELLTFARTQGYRQDEIVALIQART